MGLNFKTSFSILETNSFSGGSPSKGSMVSLQDSIPPFKINTATIRPPIPSTGNAVKCPAIMERITTLVEIMSPKLSFATASMAADFIFFAMPWL